MANDSDKLDDEKPKKHDISGYFSHQVCTEQRPDRVSLVIQLSPDMIAASAGLLMQASQYLDELFEDFNPEMAQLYASTAYELRAATPSTGGIMTFNPEILPVNTAPTFNLDNANPKDLILGLPAWERQATPPKDVFVTTWATSQDNTWSTVETSVVLDASGTFYTHYITNYHPLV